MSYKWPITIFIISSFLMATLSHQEQSKLTQFHKVSTSPQFSQFKKAAPELNKNNKILLRIWESMITGRTQGIPHKTKDLYKRLGLSHLFTPSGFHLSALLIPIFILLKSRSIQLLVLLTIFFLLQFIQGQDALKRMAGVKLIQKKFGTQLGFIMATLFDVIFGTFQNSPLGFTYSFLFLGIVYSQKSKKFLILWFFLAQLLIAYFQHKSISPLLIFLNPMITFLFSMLIPILFILSFPLFKLQLLIGLNLMGVLHSVVIFGNQLINSFSQIEPNIFFLLIVILFIMRKLKLVCLFTLILSSQLNYCPYKRNFLSKYELSKSNWSRCHNETISGEKYLKCSLKRRGSTIKN